MPEVEELELEQEQGEDIIEFASSEPIRIKTVLTGRTPILMHAYTSQTGPTQSTKLTDKYDDEWRKTAYVNPDGYLYVPDFCIEAMIQAAGAGRKVRKFYLKSFIASGVIVEEQYPRLTVKGKQITLDDVERNKWIFTCGAVVGKSRIDRHRVRLNDWELQFTIKLDSPIITPQVLSDILIDGSTRKGLLDQRPGSPNKPGKFGQFFVTKFEREN
jgi:hypothetical protein